MELPTDEEMKKGIKNLEKVKYKVDYIITHCCPTSVQAILSGGRYKKDYFTDYLQKISEKCEFKKWYFGHYHDNIQYMDAQLLYEEIKELGKPDTIQKVGRPRYRVGETVYFTYGKEDAREGYGTVEWVDDHGTLGQEKEVSYDIVGISCDLPGKKTLFKHIRESKIQSIDEMEIVRIEREEE